MDVPAPATARPAAPAQVTEAGSGESVVSDAEPGWGAEVAALGETLGERATLLQFSTAFCAPCRVTRRVLAGVAEVVPGVRHVEVDAEAHLDLVRALGVRRTPTVVVLDAAGRETRRASGAPPTRAAVFATLAEIMPLEGTKRADDDSSESSAMS
ncbi:thioredoxin family protein [Frankia sp. AgPm24]|uniref:thioredoxin family protein n=1 Tax=Frankia sp. AgPm24 TaxID=631128 RepID=UPI00200EB20C|nr:thioredoxin family protein [Frankia sp. AgPm24]MCK9924603.1 thioredoxin family protein [Frankia sp. AgPm24]